MLYISFHYFAHKKPATFTIDFFDEYFPPTGEKPATGGGAKQKFLSQDEFLEVEWKCAPLNTLLHDLTVFFDSYYAAASIRPKRATAKFRKLHDQLRKVDVLLAYFNKALASSGWLDNDALEDQYLPQSKKKSENARRKTVATARTRRDNTRTTKLPISDPSHMKPDQHRSAIDIGQGYRFDADSEASMWSD